MVQTILFLFGFWLFPVVGARSSEAMTSITRDLQTINQLKTQVRQAVDKAQNEYVAYSDRYKTFKTNYNTELGQIVKAKKDIVKQMEDKFNSFLEASEDKCRNNSNKSKCMDDAKDSYNKKAHAELVKTARALQAQTTKVADAYIGKFKDIRNEVKKIKRTLKEWEQSTKSNEHLSSEYQLVKKQRKKVSKFLNRVQSFIKKLESIVYGTMCFDFIGATGKVGASEKSKFQALVTSAMEVAAASEGIDVDVVSVKLVKQQFLANRRHLREEARDLAKRKGILRIGALIGILCNCKSDALVHDLWRRRLQDAAVEPDIVAVSASTNQDDIFDELATRELFGTTRQQRFVSALNYAFKTGSLSDVEKVEHIPCNGFIDSNPIEYINSF